jgi:hypothetical protein
MPENQAIWLLADVLNEEPRESGWGQQCKVRGRAKRTSAVPWRTLFPSVSPRESTVTGEFPVSEAMAPSLLLLGKGITQKD